MRTVVAMLLLAASSTAQQGPDVVAQKQAMQRLAYLVGDWSGDATVYLPGGPVQVRQTEHVELKLDGLMMVMEGTGRMSSGEVKFRAFATISYDDAAKVYRFRSYNDGRYLDTELKVVDRGFEWGYQAGPAKVRFTMRLTPAGEWSESGEVVVAGNPPRKSLEMTVRKQ